MLNFSEAVRKKLLQKHGVTEKEVWECFRNLQGCFLRDDREDHATDPPTQWFIARTNKNRLLKVVFVFQDKVFHIKTAYEPEEIAIRIYDAHGF